MRCMTAGFCSVALSCLITSGAIAQAQNSVSNLGSLLAVSSGAAVSAGGDVVVGTTSETGPSVVSRAFRWTAATGLVDIGALPGAASTSATALSADGAVVVGNSGNRAFRWSLASGLTGLGSLVGADGFSWASGVSADGSVVVGRSESDFTASSGPPNKAVVAVIWRPGATAQALFAPADALSFVPNSAATAVSADGKVVAGIIFASRPTTGSDVAFRWTEAGAVTLASPNPNTIGSSVVPTALNRDGSVVVGYGTIGSSAARAVRWDASGQVAQIGVLPGHSESRAFGVSGDGTIVVGASGTASGASLAFRWTEKDGIRDFNQMLRDSRVDLTNVTLTSANGISADGQFITGQGDFSGSKRAYLARYVDGLGGLTTFASVQRSVAGVRDARQRQGIRQHGLVVPLLGGNQRIGGGSDIGVFGSAASAAGGGFARIAFGNGFSLLAGAMVEDRDYRDVKLGTGNAFALAARYVHDAGGAWRPFAELGGWVTPETRMTYRRRYANGSGTAVGEGVTDGTNAYVYGRGGLAFAASADDEVAVSGELGGQRLRTKAYAEAASAANPFNAQSDAAVDTTRVVKLRGQWTHALTPQFDLTLSGALVKTFDPTSSLSVVVPGFGRVKASGSPASAWAEYGVRVGYKISQSATIDLFANGLGGGRTVGTDGHVGAALRITY